MENVLKQGDHVVKAESKDPLSRNIIFAWLALVCVLLLLIPFTAMQFTDEANWNRIDFVVMGMLLFCAGGLFICLARLINRKHRKKVAVIVLLLFCYIWAELGVGIFTNLGS